MIKFQRLTDSALFSYESSQIEDESHFLMYCIKYFILRTDEFYRKVEDVVPNFKQPFQANGKLMTSADHHVNIQVAKSNSSCFDFILL